MHTALFTNARSLGKIKLAPKQEFAGYSMSSWCPSVPTLGIVLMIIKFPKTSKSRLQRHPSLQMDLYLPFHSSASCIIFTNNNTSAIAPCTQPSPRALKSTETACDIEGAYDIYSLASYMYFRGLRRKHIMVKVNIFSCAV